MAKRPLLVHQPLTKDIDILRQTRCWAT